MTFTFLDRIAGIVGPPDGVVAAARAALFREPVRHEGLRRLPRAAVELHVAQLAARAANERLAVPLSEALFEHARAAGEEHEVMTGEGLGTDGYRDAVVAAFAGNDCGIDVARFAVGEATAEAVCAQVLTVPAELGALDAVLARMGVTPAMLAPLVDEVLAPTKSVGWSLRALAQQIHGQRLTTDGKDEALKLLFHEDPECRATGVELIGAGGYELDEWLDERAVLASPEQDEADVAEVLRLVNEEGGGRHDGQFSEAGDIAAPGAEASCPAPGASITIGNMVVGGSADLGTQAYCTLPRPVAAEPSDLTRAVSGVLKALFELTKESDTNVARVLGVEKAVVAQSRKGATPWAPDAATRDKLLTLVLRYTDGLTEARDALVWHCGEVIR